MCVRRENTDTDPKRDGAPTHLVLAALRLRSNAASVAPPVDFVFAAADFGRLALARILRELVLLGGVWVRWWVRLWLERAGDEWGARGERRGERRGEWRVSQRATFTRVERESGVGFRASCECGRGRRVANGERRVE